MRIYNLEEKREEKMEGKGRQGKAREGKGREGKGRQGKARQGKARQGKARQGKTKKRYYTFHSYRYKHPKKSKNNSSRTKSFPHTWLKVLF